MERENFVRRAKARAELEHRRLVALATAYFAGRPIALPKLARQVKRDIAAWSAARRLRPWY